MRPVAPLLAAFVLALSAGCASPQEPPAADRASRAQALGPDAVNADADGGVVGEWTSWRWALDGDGGPVSARLVLDFGAGVQCDMRFAMAGHPTTSGLWGGTRFWAGEGGTADARYGVEFDASSQPGQPPLMTYHALGLASSAAAPGDNDVAASLTSEGRYVGPWTLDVVVEEAGGWPNEITDGAGLLLEVACPKGFQVVSSSWGREGKGFAVADGAGVGATAWVEPVGVLAAAQAADVLAADMASADVTVWAGCGTLFAGVLELRTPTATLRSLPDDCSLFHEGGPGLHEVEVTGAGQYGAWAFMAGRSASLDRAIGSWATS